jgi:antitoxin FitA
MRCACAHLSHMSKMIQIRNVSDELHAKLRRRAEKQGMTLTAYLERVLEREVARPLPQEVFERIAARSAVKLEEPVAFVIRQEREGREAG